MEPARGEAGAEAGAEHRVRDGSTLPGWPMAMRREKAAAYLDVSPSTFDTMTAAPGFPKAIPIHGSVKAWHRADLDAFLEDRRAAAIDAAAPPAEEWAAP